MTEPGKAPCSAYLKAARSPCFHTPLFLGVSVRPRLKSRGLETCGSSGIRRGGQEVSSTTAGTRPGSHCPGTCPQHPGTGGREECCGASGRSQGQQGGGRGDRGVPGQGTVCSSATLLSQPPPASVQRAPTSLRQEPDLPSRRCPAAQPQPPACSVCFPSHFTKCLLIFSTKSQCLPRGAQVSTH